jgi:hypothetical protein
VEKLSEALPCSGQPALGIAPVGPTQCETRWRAVLASLDKQYEALTAKYPEATKEINLIRTGLIRIGQLIETSPQQNGNGATWKRRVRKASFVNTLTGRPCSLECCDYTQQHTEDGGQSPAGVCARKTGG